MLQSEGKVVNKEVFIFFVLVIIYGGNNVVVLNLFKHFQYLIRTSR